MSRKLHIHAPAIHYFDMVRRCHSIREAARRLNVASSAVNRQILKDFELENYLFGDATRTLSTEQREQVTERLKHEMLEIFYARNMPR